MSNRGLREDANCIMQL